MNFTSDPGATGDFEFLPEDARRKGSWQHTGDFVGSASATLGDTGQTVQVAVTNEGLVVHSDPVLELYFGNCAVGFSETRRRLTLHVIGLEPPVEYSFTFSKDDADRLMPAVKSFYIPG